MPGLPPDLYREVRRVLMDCPAFDSDRELRALFRLDSRLHPWRNRVPEASSRESRVQAVMALLVNAANTSRENALVLLLQVLCDLAEPTDSVQPDLYRLSGELAAVLEVDSPRIPATEPPPAPTAAPGQTLPPYRSVMLRIFDRNASAEPDEPFRVELGVSGGRDFPPAQLRLDFGRLAALATDSDDYGRELGEMLFADNVLGSVYREVLAVVHSHAERIRVRLQLEAPELHAVRWERIHHPVSGAWYPLAATADALLSRYVPTEGWGPVQPVMMRPLRVLVVLASPRDPGDEGRVPIQEDEWRRWHAVFDRLPGAQVTYLQTGTADAPTLEAVRHALLRGHELVQFVCYGARTQQGISLVLEKEHRRSDYVNAARLLEMLRGLPARPALCSLAACESGAFDPVGDFAALGPALVGHGGIPAVVAMAEPVRLTTALAFSRQFYERLFAHGIVDLAVHEARAAVREQLDWSVPILFSRLPENRLWPGPHTH
jgi:hypothetical protein